MLNFNKYRYVDDEVELESLFTYLYKKDELGELKNLHLYKDTHYLRTRISRIHAERFDFEKFVLDSLNRHFVKKMKFSDISICGRDLVFWKQENKNWHEDVFGEYYVRYVIWVKINGSYIDAEDMRELFPHFAY